MKIRLFKKYRISLVFAILFLLSVFTESNAQTIPCLPRHTGFSQVYKNPSQYPAFNTDMPFDVLIGYIAMDSVAKNADYKKFENLKKNLTKSDTLKYLRKYFYELTDYDPLLLTAYRYHNDSNYKNLPFNFLKDIESKIKSLRYEPIMKNDYAFFSAAAITHVRVLGKEKKNNQNAALAKTEINLCTEIVDVLKGKYLHSEYCEYSPSYDKQNTDYSINLPPKNNYLSFMYSLEWPILADRNEGSYKKTIGDLYGDSLFTIGNEYIVFTRLMNYCDYDNKTYFNYATTFSDTSNELLVFPIIDGKVLDSRDEFGFGTNLSVNEFKDAIKKRIETIKKMEYQ